MRGDCVSAVYLHLRDNSHWNILQYPEPRKKIAFVKIENCEWTRRYSEHFSQTDTEALDTVEGITDSSKYQLVLAQNLQVSFEC